MMWWNGGRERRDGDRQDGMQPARAAGFALLIFAPIIAKVMQATISRKRETLADMSPAS
jgi:heat shock protein HtpX